MPNLRILIVMPLAEQRGGGELMVIHLIQAGRERGVDWTVVFLQDGPMVARIRGYGVDAIVIPSGKMRNLPRLLSTAKQIADVCRRKQIDLIVGWMGTGHLYGGLASLLCKAPAIWYQLGVPFDNIIDKIVAHLPARLVMACSQGGADAQAKLTPRLPMRVVYPAVELDRFDPARVPTPREARARLGLPATGALIGIVGRLQRWKGMHVFVEAMPDVLKQYPDAHGLIVGGVHTFEPDYPAYLDQVIDLSGVRDHLVLAGLQSNVQDWVQAMDVFVHASDNEPFGIVIIEAMALGKPVIAANSGGPTEIITEGVNGLLTPYGDAAALSTAIIRYLQDPAFAERLAKAGRERAQDFSTARYAQALIDCCREACAVAPAAPAATAL